MIYDRHYPKAPIVEAIIDIRVELSADLKIEELKRMGVEEKESYPKSEELIKLFNQVKFQAGMSASTISKQDKVGFKFTSKDKLQVFQAHVDGFTFSRLGMYESWQVFRDEACRLWRIYRTEFNPQTLRRLAVRFINRIDIPKDEIDLKDYFRTSPEISPDLPQKLDGFFMQLRLPQSDIKAGALINQTMVEPTQPDRISIILDIDVFRNAELPQEEAAVWNYFEQLHDRKNLLFESCITDKTRELFL